MSEIILTATVGFDDPRNSPKDSKHVCWLLNYARRMKAKLAVCYGHVFRKDATTCQRSCMRVMCVFRLASQLVVNNEDDAEFPIKRAKSYIWHM